MPTEMGEKPSGQRSTSVSRITKPAAYLTAHGTDPVASYEALSQICIRRYRAVGGLPIACALCASRRDPLALSQLLQYVLTRDHVVVGAASVLLDRGDEVVEVVVALDAKRNATRAGDDACSSSRRAFEVEYDARLVTDDPGVVSWANDVGITWSEVALVAVSHFHVELT